MTAHSGRGRRQGLTWGHQGPGGGCGSPLSPRPLAGSRASFHPVPAPLIDKQGWASSLAGLLPFTLISPGLLEASINPLRPPAGPLPQPRLPAWELGLLWFECSPPVVLGSLHLSRAPMQERFLRGALQSKGPLFWGPTEEFTSAWDVTY